MLTAIPESKLQRDILQLPNERPKAEHDHAGASHNRAREDQGIAEAEILDRNPKTDPPRGRPTEGQSRRSTAQASSNSPPGRARNARSRQRHDTVILRASPTSNCRRRSGNMTSPAKEYSPCTVLSAKCHARMRPLPCRRLLRRIGEITPQLPITWKWNCAIWMPGNEAQKRQRWARGTPGYQ